MGLWGPLPWRKGASGGTLWLSTAPWQELVGVGLFSQVTRDRQEEMASSVTREGLDWIWGKKNPLRKGCQALEQAAHKSGGVTITGEV